RAAVAALIVAIVGFAVWQDRRLGPLNVGADESMYPETIHWAEQQLPRDAIVLNQQFSGSFLYYSGRDTVRFDELDNDRFQLLRAYAGAANLQWFALLTPEELEQVRGRFAANWTPLGQHRGMWLMRVDYPRTIAREIGGDRAKRGDDRDHQSGGGDAAIANDHSDQKKEKCEERGVKRRVVDGQMDVNEIHCTFH